MTRLIDIWLYLLTSDWTPGRSLWYLFICISIFGWYFTCDVADFASNWCLDRRFIWFWHLLTWHLRFCLPLIIIHRPTLIWWRTTWSISNLLIIQIRGLSSRSYSVSIACCIWHRFVNIWASGTHSLARITWSIWHFGSSAMVLILNGRLVVTSGLWLPTVICWIAIDSLEFVELINSEICFHLLFSFLSLLLSLQFLCLLALFHLFLLLDFSLSFLLKSL